MLDDWSGNDLSVLLDWLPVRPVRALKMLNRGMAENALICLHACF